MKIKFCGITKQSDYEYIVNSGANYTGFIFFEKSKRYISPKDAGSIIVENSKNLRIGVFVNETSKNIKSIYKTANLDIVQLHGDETPEFCEELNLPYWKVFRVGNIKDIKKFRKYNCNTILIDTYSKDKYGGTGKVIDYDLIKLSIDKANILNKKIIVAGGISIDNINKITKLSPFAVDVNSGVEIEAGIKDLNKVSEIMNYIKFIK